MSTPEHSKHGRSPGFDFGQSTVKSTVAAQPTRVLLSGGMSRNLRVDEVAGVIDIADVRERLRRLNSGTVGVQVVWEPRGARVRLVMGSSGPGKAFTRKAAEEIVVAAVPFHAGGVRRFFLCTHCGRRCRRLYAPVQGDPFRCRLCHSLTYASCQATRLGRDRTPKPLAVPDWDDPDEIW